MEDLGLVTKAVNKLRLAILDVSPESFVPFYDPHYKAVVVRFGNGTKGGRWSNYIAAFHLEVLPLLQPPTLQGIWESRQQTLATIKRQTQEKGRNKP